MIGKRLSLEYKEWFTDLNRQTESSQIRAHVFMSCQLTVLYYDLGRQFVEKQEHSKLRSKFIENLSKDLKSEFLEMTDSSKDKLLLIKIFYLFYISISNKREPVAHLFPQLRNVFLLSWY